MSCIVNNFRQEFPHLQGNRIVLDNTVDMVKLRQWVNTVNSQVKTQGFNEGDIFNIEFKEVKALRGHSYKRNNVQRYEVLTINNELAKSYEDFLNQEFFSQLEMDKEFSRELSEQNSFQEDYDLSNNMLQEQEDRIDFEYGDVMFQPLNNFGGNNSTIDEDPTNYREWRQVREDLLKRLQKTKNRILLTKDKAKLKQLNSVIDSLEKEIQEFDDENMRFVFESVLNEIDSLNQILEQNLDDPFQLANIMETNEVRTRLKVLQDSFYKERKEGDSILFKLFQEGFKDTSIFADKVLELSNKYDKYMDKIMYSIVSNNEYIRELEKAFTSDQQRENWKAFMEKMEELSKAENPNRDGDTYLGKNFLGAGSYDSMFVEIISIIRDINKNKEVGITSLWKKTLQTTYDKIKNIKIGKEYLVDKLFQKDEFGNNTDFLVNPFTREYYSTFNILKSAKKEFFSKRRNSVEQLQAYKDYLDYMKDNFDYINPAKIKSFVDRHSDTPQFSEFFKYSDSEMDAYEKEMRAKMGNMAFEIELERQVSMVENYLIDEFKSEPDAYHKNPLRFIEHFYSANYNSVDTTTGDFILPMQSYVRFIPKLDSAEKFNEEFRNLDDLNIDGLTDFYKSALNLLDYIREAGKSANVPIGINEIIAMEETAGRAAMQELSFFGKVGLNLKNIIKNIFGSADFYQGQHENAERNPNYDPKKDRQFQSKYYSYGKSQMKKMIEIMEKDSLDTLLKKAAERNLTVPTKYKTDSNFSKKRIAEAIARHDINKSSSLDIFKRINYATTIAESINTRLTTKSMLSLVKDYVTNEKLHNTREYLEVWEANNILQVGALQTKNGLLNFEKRKVKKFLGVIDTKKYNEAEKILKKMYEDELHNFNEEYDFYYNGSHYKKVDNEYFKGDEVISKIEIKTAFENHMNDELNELGKNPTYGTIINGLAWKMFKAYLHINIKSGFNNRVQNYNQNNQAAAAGLYGFDSDNLWVARKFLTGIGIYKLLSYVPGSSKIIPNSFGPINVKKKQQWDILMHLAHELGLLENVLADVSGGEGDSNTFTNSNFKNKLSELAADFAMNIPEIHGQMELLVAMMQRVKIEKFENEDGTGDIIEDGANLFDAKTMKLPFDPHTMKLLPQYRTPNNIKNWENFKVNESGNSPQNVLTRKYISTKHKLNGNYRLDDKIGMQSTMTGRAGTAFMKWSYENLNNQYGTKRISLTTGEIDVKGRKLVLAERFPVFAFHMAINNIGIGSTIAGGAALIAGSTTLGMTVSGLGTMVALAASPVGILASVAGTAVIAHAIYRNKINISTSKENFIMIGSYFMEFMARTLKTSIATLSKGHINTYSDTKLNNWLGLTEEKWKATGTSLEERKKISESAQELSDKYNLYIQFAITGLLLKGMYLLLTGAWDDDEEEQMKKLAEIEGNLKFLINQRNQMTAEIEKWTNPMAIKELHEEVVLARFIDQSIKKVIESSEKYESGKISQSQMVFEQVAGVTGPVLGVPRQAIDFVNPEKDMFASNRVFDTSSMTVFDRYLLNSLKTGEKKYETLLNGKKDKVKFVITKKYEKRIREEFKKTGRTDYHNIKDLVKENIKENFETNKLYKKRGKGSYKDIYENADWQKVEDDANTSPLILNTKSKKSKSKSSSKKVSKNSSK